MAKLISDSEFLEIRSALRDVADTFFTSPLTYYIGRESLDRWQEDRADKAFYAIDLEALKENTGNASGNELRMSEQGFEDISVVQLTFNVDYLQEKGLLTDDFRVKFDPERDYFKLQNQVYKVISVSVDGPLQPKDVLIVVKGKIAENWLGVNTIQSISDASQIKPLK